MAQSPTPSRAEQDRLAEVAGQLAAGPAGIPALIVGLADPSWVVRRAVVAALASLGEPAVGPLCTTLRDARDSEARIAAAVDTLVASTGEVESALTGLLHENAAVLADCAQILGRRGRTTSVPVLARLAEHPDDTVSVAALESLGRIGGRAAVDCLVQAIESGNFFRTFPAIDVLGRSEDPRAIAPLAKLLSQPQYTMEATRALGRTGSRSAIPPLCRVLCGGGASTSRIAALALDELLTRHEQRFGAGLLAEEALRSELRSVDAVDRIAALIDGAETPEQIALCRLLGVTGNPAAASVLGALLSSRSTGVATAAARALRQVGGGIDTPLQEALRRGNSELRLAVLPLLRTRAAARDVQSTLTDAAPEVRALAAETLGRLVEPATLPALFERLSDRSPLVVQAALTAIQCFSSGDVEPHAITAARSTEIPVRRAAVRILAFYGIPAALPVFRAALNDPDPRVRDSGIQGLALVEEPAGLETLLEVTRSPQPQARSAAMRALGTSLGGTPIEAALVRGLQDPDAWVRYYACQSLGKLRVTLAIGAIEALLADPAPHVRLSAVEALSHFSDPRALQTLRKAATDEDEDLRRGALVGLGIAAEPSSLPLLIEAAHSANAATRLVALSSLAAFPSPTVVVELSLAMSDPDETVRGSAAALLAARDDLEATQELIASLSRPAVREVAARALTTPAHHRVQGILEALETADAEVAAELASILTQLPGPEAPRALTAMIQSSNAAARRAAAPVIAAAGTPEALLTIRDASLHDPDPEVRRVCALLLAG